MDANAELAAIRALCTAIECGGDDLSRYTSEYADALVPLFRALDERMREGETAPGEWRVRPLADKSEED